MTNDVITVFVLGLITAAATGLGALPFIFFKNLSERTAAISNAIAGGLMFGACVGLWKEGAALAVPGVVIGTVVGVIFIAVTHRWMSDHPSIEDGFAGKTSRDALLILVAMTVHSFAEGVAVGVAFGGGAALATLITLAIAVHNVPEGLAISAAMRPRGASIAACAGWSVVSSLPQPIMAVPAFVFVEAFRPVLPYGLGFAAGAMVYLVLTVLIPDALRGASAAAVGVASLLSMAAMVAFQLYI